MRYQVIIETHVDKETKNISQRDMQRIDKVILGLRDNPRPFGCKKLTEREGYRIRVGHYRILYTIDEEGKVVIIYRVRKKDESTYK